MVGYVRVSTIEQSEERQIVKLREGDKLIVSEFSRFVRSTNEIILSFFGGILID